MGACLSDLRTLPFWLCDYHPDIPALWLDGEVFYSYGQLADRINYWADECVAASKSCLLFYCANHPESVALITAVLANGHTLILADPKLSDSSKIFLEETYLPHWVAHIRDGIVDISSYISRHYSIHKDLCLMLSTSGSTGSPKYVRLSNNNVLTNADAIGSVLNISAEDIASAHLDLHYSYGFSVLTSHLKKGAGIAFSTGKFTDREFWQSVKDANVTHFPGVPLHYQMMSRLRFERLTIPSVRVMTQAGGSLSKPIRDQAFEFMQSRNGKFYVMYGQTEAAPRMSTLLHEDYAAKKNTVGKALPGGIFKLIDENSNSVEIGGSGHVVYEGPNVMMGYAHSWEDLNNGDVLSGKLETGDLGKLDSDGFLTIIGRISRIGKVFGLRINLDEVEVELSKFGKISVIQDNEFVGIVYETDDSIERADIESKLAEHLAQHYQVPASGFHYYAIDRVPVTTRNKTDYVEIMKMIHAD